MPSMAVDVVQEDDFHTEVILPNECRIIPLGVPGRVFCSYALSSFSLYNY